MVDSSIIALVKQGKHPAFKELYQSSIGYVFSIVKRYVSNESDYPDVIQEIFARVFLSIKSFDESKGEYKFWLRRLVINQCLQHYRQGKSPRQIIPMDNVEEVDLNIERKLNELTKTEIELFLKQMPDGYKQVFMLVILDEYSHKEVSEMLGISIETSRSQLSRAKNWIRKKKLDNNNQKKLAIGF